VKDYTTWKKETQFEVEFQIYAWKGAHREVELEGKLQRDVNQVKVLREGERVHLDKARDGASRGGKSAKGPGERGKS